MISERTLKKWRRKALEEVDCLGDGSTAVLEVVAELYRIILRLTQELLDQHLLRKGGEK